MPKKEPTGWVGWVYFASAMMVLAGGMQIISGLVALFKDDYFVVTQSHILAFDYSTWGWVHLVAGIVLLSAGMAVAAGRVWGRTIGVVIAVLSAMLNLAFLSSYPIWSIIMIIVDIFVIYALTVKGSEVKEDY